VNSFILARAGLSDPSDSDYNGGNAPTRN